jgi:adenosylcobinamide kinase/adenosylcobinamide-phosphate guanylyltransferase
MRVKGLIKMAGKIILVTGGARSGKSEFAEQYALMSGKPVAYIATAQIYDEEMRLRVALHRQRRPNNWRTYEAPYFAEKAIDQAVTHADIILFDCLTLYTSNLLLAPNVSDNQKERGRYIAAQIELLLESARSSQATVIFVTNEVGMGVVPENALAREYRDVAGLANQQVAACADEVYLVVSGLAVDIKKLAVNTSKEVQQHG